MFGYFEAMSKFCPAFSRMILANMLDMGGHFSIGGWDLVEEVEDSPPD